MLFSKIIRKKFDAVWCRYDGSPEVYCYGPTDFPQLHWEPWSVEGEHDVTLKGYFYCYGEPDPDQLVVFDHGIGAGHRAYMTEIEYLARSGYTVYSYDHTGCVESGGTGIYGFAQGICDLDRVLTQLHQDARFCEKPVRLVGHSWGAYSAMNAAALHPEVTHVVALAGFLSARTLEEQYLPKFVRKYSDEVMSWERQANPRYADLDARDSMKKSRAALLFIQSRDDTMVHYSLAMEPLMQALSGRPKTEFLTLEDRNHEPHHTVEAVQAYAAMRKAQQEQKKSLTTPEGQKAFLASQDWKAMTAQDPQVWEKILNFLK